MSRIVQAVDFGTLGKAYYERRAIPEALDCFRHDLRHGADPRKHAFERWASWMLLGEFEEAWKESDRCGVYTCGVSGISGRVVVRCLRGLGDAIQFLRYVPELRRNCACITVQTPSRLTPLLERTEAIDRVLPVEFALDRDFDYEIECSDLPYLFRTTPATIPAADEHLSFPLATNLARSGDFSVGLVWAAGSWNPVRSIPLALLEPLTRIPGVTLVSLQRGCEAEQLREFHGRTPIRETERETGSILDTIATLRQLDLVISVDTMVAHLAGALGKPVWTLLTFAADWRWMLNRSDTPWYPSMRLFRQSRPGDWNSVIRRVTAELSAAARFGKRNMNGT